MSNCSGSSSSKGGQSSGGFDELRPVPKPVKKPKKGNKK